MIGDGLSPIAQFVIQHASNFDAVDESGSFMVTAEGADRIENSVHFLQLHTVHGPVKFIEICFDLLVVKALQFDIAFIKQRQHRCRSSLLQRMGLDVFIQNSEIPCCYEPTDSTAD